MVSAKVVHSKQFSKVRILWIHFVFNRIVSYCFVMTSDPCWLLADERN